MTGKRIALIAIGCFGASLLFLLGVTAFVAVVDHDTKASAAIAKDAALPTHQVSAESLPTDVVSKTGSPVPVGSMTYTVVRSWWSDRLSKNQFINRHADGKYLFVVLTVMNDSAIPASVGRFGLASDTGAISDVLSEGTMLKGALTPFDEINPQVDRRGVVVFDVDPSRRYRLFILGGASNIGLVDLEPEAAPPGN